MPNLKKASNVKMLSGTYDSKDRKADADGIGQYPALTQVPKPPPWLTNSHALAEWKRLAPILTNAKVLTEAGLMAFTHMCNLHGKMVQLWAAGEVPGMSMMNQYRVLITDFGLTPIAQTRIKQLALGKAPGDDNNAFNRNGRQAKAA